jgi:hypothetical protein
MAAALTGRIVCRVHDSLDVGSGYLGRRNAGLAITWRHTTNTSTLPVSEAEESVLSPKSDVLRMALPSSPPAELIKTLDATTRPYGGRKIAKSIKSMSHADKIIAAHSGGGALASVSSAHRQPLLEPLANSPHEGIHPTFARAHCQPQ